MNMLTREEIFKATESIKGGRIARITYKTEVPLKAAYKKQGYKITKIVETSVRFGVNYNNIASVIQRRENEEKVTSNRANNYEWIVDNRIKYNTNTEKEYLVVASLNHGHNTKVKYIMDRCEEDGVDLGSNLNEIVSEYVQNHYMNRAANIAEVRTIALDNILCINNTGYRFTF